MSARYLARFLSVALLLANSLAVLAQVVPTVTITFNGVTPFQDFSEYVESGFSLVATPGQVRVNNAFSPGNNAAQPSFGFGQGMDSRFTLRDSHGRVFDLLSLDLLEATAFPAAYSVVVMGTRGDASTVSQTITLDGVAGAQTFAMPADFTNLISVSIRENPTNQYPTEIVQIDNIVVRPPPPPTVTITFNGVTPFQDFSEYVESGFSLVATPGQVRVNNAFSPGNNAAQPSFGFGQGMDSRFTLREALGRSFDLLSLDLLEATAFPAAYSVVITGTRADASTASQTFTLDGVAGAQTFAVPADFTNLTSVSIRENPTNQYATESVQIDNIVVRPPPPTIGALNFYAGLTIVGGVGQKFRVDYADVLVSGSTNWQVLTNILLPSSPYLLIDPASPGRARRFYRSVPLP
jgi:hypothetical protein